LPGDSPLKRLLSTLGVTCLLGLSSSAFGEIRVRHYESAALVASPAKQGVTPLKISLAGGRLDASLTPNASLLRGMPADVREQLAATEVALFEGRLDGIAGSWVRLSRQGARWQGAWFDGQTLFLLDPVESAPSRDRLPPAASHVAYRLEDVVIDGLDHDMAGRPGGYTDWTRELALQFGAGKAGLKELELTVVTDTEFTAVHGAGNRDAVVAGRLNVVDGIYRAQLSVQVTLRTLRHLSNNGPMTMTLASGGTSTSPDLLDTFQDYMLTGAGSSIPKGDLNHLFSGKDFDGSTAGVAFVGVLCSSSFGYAINQVRNTSTTTALIIAHEMGHNVGASHDGQSGSNCATQTGGWIMSPSISSANNQFSPCSLGIMTPRVAAASCLSAVAAPTMPIYANGFED
jgi:hypothetical protein